jgi:hypothetical protein
MRGLFRWSPDARRRYPARGSRRLWKRRNSGQRFAGVSRGDIGRAGGSWSRRSSGAHPGEGGDFSRFNSYQVNWVLCDLLTVCQQFFYLFC